MNYVSSRGGQPPVSVSEAIERGAAPDGGLYLPAEFPRFDAAAATADLSLPDFAARFLGPFFEGDVLEDDLADICADALDVPVPIVTPSAARSLSFLELFHGPTGAFKDFGARFLMGCFDRIGDPADPFTVLAATSGDTGGAVGCAAEGRSAVRAVILYPKGRVSPFQEHQLTCWGANVRALEVDGDFDDCQRLVKQAFANRALSDRFNLTSANSINIGRLLPQAAYVAHAAVRRHAATGQTPGFIVPSGNLGHGFAVLLARAMGAPIGPVILATNANQTLKDWSNDGRFRPRPSVETLANAMDVGNPSNFERLTAIGINPDDVRVEQVGDDRIKARIRAEHDTTGYVLCPHTATAAEAYDRLSDGEKTERPWIALATAHPFKFAETVEPLISVEVAPTPALAAIFDRPMAKRSIRADPAALAEVLTDTVPA